MFLIWMILIGTVMFGVGMIVAAIKLAIEAGFCFLTLFMLVVMAIFTKVMIETVVDLIKCILHDQKI